MTIDADTTIVIGSFLVVALFAIAAVFAGMHESSYRDECYEEYKNIALADVPQDCIDAMGV